jgi:hypothetical protein
MSPRAKLIAVAAPIAVIVIVVAVIFASGGGGPSQAAKLAAAKQFYCTDLRALTQQQRGPAVARASRLIRKDARSFRQAGDPETAQELIAVAHAAKRVVAALADNKDPSAAAAAMQKSIAKAPAC